MLHKIQSKTAARRPHLLAALVAGATLSLPMTGRASDIPVGQLPSGVTPTAYRLDLTADPAKDGFHGHAEIDIQLATPTRSLFLNGRDLTVNLAAVRVGAAVLPSTYTQVDPSGVVRVDFSRELPAGRALSAPPPSSPRGLGWRPPWLNCLPGYGPRWRRRPNRWRPG